MSGLILAQPQESRRDRLANLVLLRRLGRYDRRLGAEKLVMVAIAIVITMVSGHRAVGWLLLVPAVVASGLHVLAVHVSQGTPRGRLLRRYEAHLSGSDGHPQLNLPALTECIGTLSLVVGGAWAVTDLSDLWRLAYVAAATAYACLVSCTIFDDSTWYNPEVRSPRWQEIDRLLCGVQVCALVLVVGWWAPWHSADRIGLLMVSAIGFIVPLRAGATQLLVADLAPIVEAERQRGTRLVIEEASRELLPILTEIRQLAADRAAEEEACTAGDEAGTGGGGSGTAGRLSAGSAAAVAELADAALAGLVDIPNQVAHSARQGAGQPLRIVADRLVSLAAAAGRKLSVTMPEELELAEDDRQLAGQAIRDLGGNAIGSGAGRIYIELRRAGPRMVVIVADDGRPIPDGAWKTPGSSSASFEARLIALGGSLTAESSPINKVVIATWVVRSG